MSNPNLNHKVIDGVLVVIPTREQVQALTVGDLAPDCFGRWAKVTRVYGQQDDMSGKAFVCYYTEFGEHSTVSNSMKEGEVCLTTAASHKWPSRGSRPAF